MSTPKERLVWKELWGITTLFNPKQERLRLENYRKFRARSRAQGLRLVTLELAFEDAPFELGADDAEILIQKRSSSVLWQKERLLNIGLKVLPPSCDKVVWADADVLFEDDNWVQRTSLLLNRYVVLQPFSVCIRLPQGGNPNDYGRASLDKTVFHGDDEGTYGRSVCSRMTKKWAPKFSGSTGYVWAARRSFLAEVGFYDRCIVGGADREMALAFHYPPGEIPPERRRITHPALLADLHKWHEKVHQRVEGKVNFRKGVIHHLWHGSTASRKYSGRHAILADHDFDPQRDLALDEQGCWQLSDRNPQLIRAIGEYFESRATPERSPGPSTHGYRDPEAHVPSDS